MKKRLTAVVLGLLALITLIGALSAIFAADRSPTLVVFTANWCASCRDVVPVVQQVGSQSRMNVVVIDVDRQDAPKTAQSYSLNIPTTEPPQVFYVNGGQVRQVYNGKDFRFGYEDMVRSTIEQNLQGAR